MSYFEDGRKVLSDDELIEVLVAEIEALMGIYEGEYSEDWVVYEEIAHLFEGNRK